MADAQQQHAPGGHYSGSNKIPTINQFIEKLDRDKATRDKQIDEQKRAKATGATGDAVPHQQIGCKIDVLGVGFLRAEFEFADACAEICVFIAERLELDFAVFF